MVWEACRLFPAYDSASASIVISYLLATGALEAPRPPVPCTGIKVLREAGNVLERPLFMVLERPWTLEELLND